MEHLLPCMKKLKQMRKKYNTNDKNRKRRNYSLIIKIKLILQFVQQTMENANIAD
jgi:hypothetical protein